jgi:hypothetical protein
MDIQWIDLGALALILFILGLVIGQKEYIPVQHRHHSENL